MSLELQRVLPAEIERRSLEIITQELDRTLDPEQADVILRVIHASADFTFADALCFTPDVCAKAVRALRAGCCVVTDTRMAWSGINKRTLAALGGEAFCFIDDPEVAEAAKKNGTTRSAAAMDRAAALGRPTLFAIGNAPTALVRLCELIEEKKLLPELVVGVPVGFVNVVESKELLLRTPVPSIVARGRKGGSPIAAAVVNALLYRTGERRA
ncbi:MAG: precorrin-8X methylmutase [Oscillospiraceae bacterium]